MVRRTPRGELTINASGVTVLAKALLQLAERSGRPDLHGASLDLHLSQRELANIVGSSRESVNKQLQIWHRAGLIDLAKGAIVIRDAAAIGRLV